MLNDPPWAPVYHCIVSLSSLRCCFHCRDEHCQEQSPGKYNIKCFCIYIRRILGSLPPPLFPPTNQQVGNAHRILLGWAVHELSSLPLRTYMITFSQYQLYIICIGRRTLGYEAVLERLEQKGISIRVASPKLVMEEVWHTHGM